MSKDRPLNPGPVWEAEALYQFTEGLTKVRKIVYSETFGVDSPYRQLGALEQLLAQHHQSFQRLMRAAVDRNNRVLAPDDAVRFIVSLIEHVNCAVAWLEVATRVPELRAPRRPPLSRRKSDEKRQDILNLVIKRCDLAHRLCEDLMDIAKQEFSPDHQRSVRRLFDDFDAMMTCLRVRAALSSRFRGLPRDELHRLIKALYDFMESSAAEDISDARLGNIAFARALVFAQLKDHEATRDALNEALKLSADDIDNQIPIILDALSFAKDVDEQSALVAQLRSQAGRHNIGLRFSRERLGRVSILRGAMPAIASNQAASDDPSVELIEDCFSCQEELLFDTQLSSSEIVRFAGHTDDSCVLMWRSGESRRLFSFEYSAERIAQMIGRVERATDIDRTVRRVVDSLSVVLEDALRRVLTDVANPRLEAFGTMGFVPLLALMVDGSPMGARSNIAYVHPTVVQGAPEISACSPPDLLIVDRECGRDAANVESAYVEACTAAQCASKVLEFDSSLEDLSVADFSHSIESSHRALFFGHARNDMAQAGKSGLVIGRDTLVTIEQLSNLQLSRLQELTLVACASGRVNPFLGSVSPAHAAALAGARQVIYTLWSIEKTAGAEFSSSLLAASAHGVQPREFFAGYFAEQGVVAAPFGLLRP